MWHCVQSNRLPDNLMTFASVDLAGFMASMNAISRVREIYDSIWGSYIFFFQKRP